MTNWWRTCARRCWKPGRKSSTCGKASVAGSEVNAAYRDIALEKARAEYELELKANLGNSMAETQVARLRERLIEYGWPGRVWKPCWAHRELTRLADAMKTEDRK